MKRLLTTIGAMLGWSALVFQFYLIIINRTVSVLETVFRYFSFFTILTNLLVAFCFTVLLVNPQSRRGKFFARPTTLTAITVYITVVGVVYNAVLRFTWNPTGLQLVVDELLHSVIPVLFILYWLLFVPKPELQWTDVFPWLIFPMVYIICILFQGTLSGFYPYPFINVTDIGYGKVLLNSAGLAAGFFIVSLTLVFLGKSMRNRF